MTTRKKLIVELGCGARAGYEHPFPLTVLGLRASKIARREAEKAEKRLEMQQKQVSAGESKIDDKALQRKLIKKYSM